MKKLFNVSPFILLLVPLFVLMVFGLFSNDNQNEEMVNRAQKVSLPAPLVKISQGIAVTVKP